MDRGRVPTSERLHLTFSEFALKNLCYSSVGGLSDFETVANCWNGDQRFFWDDGCWVSVPGNFAWPVNMKWRTPRSSPLVASAVASMDREKSLPDKKVPLYSHSLPGIEAWLQGLGMPNCRLTPPIYSSGG
jgi:hypothetical protein